MAKKWAEVVANPEFQALGSDQKELARQEYFEDVVAPQVPAESLEAARAEFDQTTDIKPIQSGMDADLAAGSAPEVNMALAPADPSGLKTAFEAAKRDYKSSLADSVSTRTGNINEATNGFNNGQVSFPSAAARVGANLFALPADVGSAAVSAITPQFIKDGISDGITYVANTDLGRGAIDKANSAAGAVNGALADSPEAAFNLKTLGTAGNAALGFIGAKGAGTGLDETGKALVAADKFATKGALGIAERLNTKEVIPTAADLKGLATQSYQKADSAGGILKPEVTNQFVNSVQAMRPQTSIGKAIGGDSAFTKMADKIETIRDQPMTLQAAQEADELLGDAIDGEFVNGRLSKEGKRLLDIQSSLREQITNADPLQVVGGKEGFAALQDGRKFYSAAMKMADVEKIVRRAENSQVPATAIKTGFRNLAEQARKRGYNADEIKAIDAAAKTGIATDALNVLGSRLGTLINTGAGFAAGGPLGAGLAFGANQAMSGAARGAAASLQKGRATDVTRAIAKRAGVNGQVPRSELLQKAFEAAKRKNP